MAYRYVYANEEEGEKGGYYVNDDGERVEWEEVQKWLTATDNITDQNDNWGDLSLYVYGNLQYVTDNLSAAQFSGASLGHSWIKLNGNNGSVTTFGTFKKGIVADGLNQGKTFQVNYEKELAYKYEGNPEAFTYMSMPITNKQRLLIDMFNLNKDNKGNSISTNNTKWEIFKIVQIMQFPYGILLPGMIYTHRLGLDIRQLYIKILVQEFLYSYLQKRNEKRNNFNITFTKYSVLPRS